VQNTFISIPDRFSNLIKCLRRACAMDVGQHGCSWRSLIAYVKNEHSFIGTVTKLIEAPVWSRFAICILRFGSVKFHKQNLLD